MKTGEVVILAVAGLLGYQYLKNNQVQNLIPGTGGTSIGMPGLNLDLSGLLSGFGGGSASPGGGGISAQDLKDIISGLGSRGSGATDTSKTDIPSLNNLLGTIPNIGDNKVVSELTNRISGLEAQLAKIPESGVGGLTQDAITNLIKGQLDKLNIPQPSDLINTKQVQQSAGGLREKLAQYAGIGGGIATSYFTKAALPFGIKWAEGLAEILLPRLALSGGLHGAAAAIPILGWLYMGADVGATIYELVSGHNIAGGWLGWGELIQGDKAKAMELTKFQVDKASAEALQRDPQAVQNQKIGYNTDYGGLYGLYSTDPEALKNQLQGYNTDYGPEYGMALRDVNGKGGTPEQPTFSEPNSPSSRETMGTPEQLVKIDWRH